jgi:hypothetical protein
MTGASRLAIAVSGRGAVKKSGRDCESPGRNRNTRSLKLLAKGIG